MAQQTIDTTNPTDLIYQGFDKVNDNFTEVYAAIVKTGMMIDYWGSAAPSGWVLANGGTIGNAASSATTRANADTSDLFTLLWNSLTDANAPVSGTRGVSAADDFAGNKRITIPDLRGRVSVGKDTGTFVDLGSEVGEETHALSEAELPVVAGHTHVVGGTVAVDLGAGYTAIETSGSSISTGSSGGFGSGTAHNNIQPSIVCNKIIKL